MWFINHLQVVYGDHESQAPPNAVHEINNNSNDLNHGFGGKFVWLVPQGNSNQQEATGGYDLALSDSAMAGYDDIGKGAGGKFRYLVKRSQPNAKIDEIGLLRSSAINGVKDVPDGWTGMSTDLNDGRGKSFLYLLYRVWKGPYISGIKVFYSNKEFTRPADWVKDSSNISADINFRFGGKTVYLVPVYTSVLSEAATSFEVRITDHADPGLGDDVGKGSGGKFRYIVPQRIAAGANASSAISRLSLIRSWHPVDRPNKSGDINAGRGQDNLHLIWEYAN